jgi:hypothetical protein
MLFKTRLQIIQRCDLYSVKYGAWYILLHCEFSYTCKSLRFVCVFSCFTCDACNKWTLDPSLTKKMYVSIACEEMLIKDVSMFMEVHCHVTPPFHLCRAEMKTCSVCQAWEASLVYQTMSMTWRTTWAITEDPEMISLTPLTVLALHLLTWVSTVTGGGVIWVMW